MHFRNSTFEPAPHVTYHRRATHCTKTFHAPLPPPKKAYQRPSWHCIDSHLARCTNKLLPTGLGRDKHGSGRPVAAPMAVFVVLPPLNCCCDPGQGRLYESCGWPACGERWGTGKSTRKLTAASGALLSEGRITGANFKDTVFKIISQR